MNINWTNSLLFFCNSLLFFSAHAQKYEDDYYQNCKIAIDLYTDNKNYFEELGEETGLSSQFLFSIVAPEITQYNYLSDKIETYSLKVFYVQGGKEYSNFSIGVFQMKPSFVEQLEDFITNNKTLKSKYSGYLIKKDTEREIRVERVKRLESLDWQIKYLSLFCEIIKEIFFKDTGLEEKEILKFYATAYNTGFHKSKKEIERISKLLLFPHFSVKKYSYGEISLWFYDNITTN
jgi:hypothetical protein